MSSESNLQVLVIDDNRDSADTLGWLLEDDGHAVHICYSAVDALEWNATLRADVILCDLGMPYMSGYEFARRTREMEQKKTARRCLLVVLTGWDNEATRALTHAAGFDHHLVKPVPYTTIRILIADYVCQIT